MKRKRRSLPINWQTRDCVALVMAVAMGEAFLADSTPGDVESIVDAALPMSGAEWQTKFSEIARGRMEAEQEAFERRKEAR